MLLRVPRPTETAGLIKQGIERVEMMDSSSTVLGPLLYLLQIILFLFSPRNNWTITQQQLFSLSEYNGVDGATRWSRFSR